MSRFSFQISLFAIACFAGLSAAASTSLNIYPKSATVETSTKVPFTCDSDGSAKCTWSLVSGVGSISSDGVYSAPSTNGTAVIQAVNGSDTNTAQIKVAGSLPPYSCDYTQRDSTANKCTMQHHEAVGTATRYYHVIIPNNYVPGQSGLVINLGNTGHGIHQYPAGGWCNPTEAGDESGGWGPYLRSVPKPAPILICAEASYFSAEPTGHPEQWNFWGTPNTTWDGGVVPDEPDFIRQVILATVRDLSLDAKKVYVVDDWNGGAMMIDQVAILNTDLIAAFGTYSAPFLNAVDRSYVEQFGINKGVHIPSPANPISMIRLGSVFNSKGGANFWGARATMCGTNLSGDLSHPLNTDDAVQFYGNADGITQFTYGDPSGASKKFCTGIYNGIGLEMGTTLEMESGNGKAGSAIAVYKLVNNGEATPWCSFDWFGSDTYCSAHDVKPPLDLQNTTCNWTKPCNHYVDTTTGYDLKGLTYKFLMNHPKPETQPGSK